MYVGILSVIFQFLFDLRNVHDYLGHQLLLCWDFSDGAVVKNPPAKEGDIGDVGSIPESGRSPRVRNGNPLQYSCLENSMDRET